MNKNPLISVIVPVYNVEKYLDKCVRSLLNQKYKNMNIILVDDGSPDHCPEMCNKFAEEYDNITVFHKQNGGLSDARNYGVQHTDREWIVFVDSDDYVEPEYIETLVDLKNKYDAEMVITRVARENENGGGKPIHKKFDDFLADKSTALYEVYTGTRVGWSACGKLYPRDVLLKNPFPIGYNEDCACMYKIINKLDRIAIGDFESNYHYIYREGSIVGSPLNEKHLHIFDICKEFEDFIKDNHPDLDILIVFMYKKSVTQLLNLQKMSWKTYKKFFMRYRALFRKNLIKVITDKRTTKSNKIYFLLLCSRPELFYIQRKILLKIR